MTKLTLLSCIFSLGLARETGENVVTANHYRVREEARERRPPECTMDQAIIAVQWSQEAESYMAVQADENGDERRQLRGGKFTEDAITWSLFMGGEDEWTAAIQVKFDMGKRIHRQLEETRESPSFLVRSCQCEGLEPVFCPLELDSCQPVGHHADSNTTIIGCHDDKERIAEAAQTSLWVATVWFALLCGCIAFSPCGRTVFHYVLDKSQPGHNEELADYMLEHHRHRAFLLLQRSVYRGRWLHRQMPAARNSNGDDEDNSPPTSLALKTHVVQVDPGASHKLEGFDEDGENLDTQCIICFQQLQNGERAGDLMCGHTFHADCLKTWLKRRNACPLCNAKDVAKPCRDKPNRSRTQTLSTASEADSSIVDESNIVLRDGNSPPENDQDRSGSASA